uniref:Uncharacterized protein n=1 Tax=Avena sativa TaxID=4498 RepID=A0ACD5UJ67_AVESA
MRYDIIKGICNGLHFLHEECHIVHLDLKPTNILMDSTMIPKIADFGLSRIFGEQQSRILTDNPEGTCGYMAPEYLTQGVVSKKADIFSLGVIVIEIITGHRDYPYFHQDSDNNTTTHLQQFTKKVLGRWTNKLMSTPNNISMESSTRQLRKCIAIALECVDPTMEKRPTTKDIIEMLNGVDKGTLEQITRQNVTVTISGPREIEHPIDKPTKIEHPFIQTIRPKEICDLPMVSLNASQTKPWIVTGHDGGYIDIFDYEMQKSIGSYTGDGYRDATTIKFIERKQWFIAGSLSGYITVYTYEREVKKITSFRANDKYLFPIDSLAVHPTQPYVLSSCRGYIQLWDWEKNWQCIQTFEKRWCHADEYDLTFNPNDTNEFASANLSKVTIWNLDSLKSYYTLCGHLDKVNCLAFFTHVNNKRYLITGSNDKTAKIWDMQKRACVHTLDGFISPVIFVASPPHFSVLITGTRDGTIHLWSATNFRFKKVINIGSPEGVYGLPCLTGSGRVVMESESALFMIDILDEESADVPKKPMSSYFKMVYTGYAFALITVVCIPLICFVYQV